MKKISCVLIIFILLLSTFSGCGKKRGNIADEYRVEMSEPLQTGIVAENGRFSLEWDAETSNISLLCKESGKVWSLLPAGQESKISPLVVRIQDTRKISDAEYESSDKAKRFKTDRIDNGIRITYYFDGFMISVPVCYTLREDSLLISINGKDVVQGHERFRLIYARPAPFLCRLANEKEYLNDDSYFFIPTDIGGTVNPVLNSSPKRRMEGGTANIASMDIESVFDTPETMGFRCYGVKDGNDAAFFIAEDTPSAVGIGVQAGDRAQLFSSAFGTFYFTDYDYFYGNSVLDGLIKQISDHYEGKISVAMYPLASDEADVSGMAKCYRRYLIKSGYIEEGKTVKDTSPYSLTVYGGVMTTSSFLGIPYSSLQAMTTFDEAQKITEEMTDLTGIAPVVRLSGYGKSGVNIGEVAGGYAFASVLGGEKARQRMETYCADQGIALYTDYNLLYFNRSGGGFSKSRDYAKTAVLYPAKISSVNVPMREFNPSDSYYLLARRLIGKTVDLLLKSAEKRGVSGIALRDLGEVSYSDYGNGSEYGVAAKMDSDTKEQLQKIKNADHRVAVSMGRYFSAGLADTVFEAPLEPSGRGIYQNEIPFAQMVFHGITPMYCAAVNTAPDMAYRIMLAASTGTGLGFDLIYRYETSYTENENEKLYGMLYADNAGRIQAALAKYADLYRAVESSKIERYDLLENGVTKTVFENGVCVYANHLSSKAETPAGTLGGYDFIMGGEAG